MYKVLTLMFLLLVLLVSCAEPEPVPELAEDHEIYMPIVMGRPCAVLDHKRGLAWGGRSRDPLADAQLCLVEGAFSYNWDFRGGHFGARNLVDLPMLWGAAQYDPWSENTPPNSTGINLGPNECDRPDQCNLPVEDVARLMIRANAHCPNCQWVSPSYSMATRCEKLPEFFDLYEKGGGDIDAFIGIGLHIYVPPYGTDVESILARCRQILPPFTRSLPFWITELGITSCDSTPDVIVEATFSRLLDYARSNPEIAHYMVFSPYWLRTKVCDFMPLFDWDDGSLTAAGRVMAK